jgi:hypothetical protein
MSTGFQQQTPFNNMNFSNTAPKPQHGQKADAEALKRKQSRSFEPKPGRA